MVSFAQRMGLRPVRSLVQTDALDEETRIELWNITVATVQRLLEKDAYRTVHGNVVRAIWCWEFKQARDEAPSDERVWGMVKSCLLKDEWFDALDMIEAVAGYMKRFEDWHTNEVASMAVDLYNSVFETHLVGYRFIDFKIVPLDSDVDVDAVAEAIKASRDYAGARGHLQRASELLSDRKNPDYRNSIKESISAVEAVVRKITREGTLGAGLKKLKAAGVTVHSALEGAWSKMYGWTSDADGIRHAALDPADADQAIAKYMLVTCSAFVTYLIEAGRKAKLV
ncbi:MAG: AbiJ-NTD4 domain-containing protein [Microbacterium sp.]|uniref:AbiJ-NTD4 domain-containing protein n=1 Tax=Microbacterium sp. TaxID=51671 RepID=UPI003D6E8E89